MWAATAAFPSTVIHLPLIPLLALFRVTRETFLLAKSIMQRRSSQLKRAEVPLVRSQRLGVPNFEVLNVWISICPPNTAERNCVGFGISDVPSHSAKVRFGVTERATSYPVIAKVSPDSSRVWKTHLLGSSVDRVANRIAPDVTRDKCKNINGQTALHVSHILKNCLVRCQGRKWDNDQRFTTVWRWL